MGTYVYYYLGDEDGIQTRFLADLGSYTAWFSSQVAEFPDDCPPSQLKKLLDIVQRGTAAFVTESDDEAHVIDRILDEYWRFRDEKDLHRELEITPSAHKLNRYAMDLSEVLPSASALANSYYRGLFVGRSLAECKDHEYRSEDGVFSVSWLLPADVCKFLSELERFGNVLDRKEDQGVGVFWVLESLKEANRRGTSLVVVIA
jgi:hypothetical protein